MTAAAPLAGRYRPTADAWPWIEATLYAGMLAVAGPMDRQPFADDVHALAVFSCAGDLSGAHRFAVAVAAWLAGERSASLWRAEVRAMVAAIDPGARSVEAVNASAAA